MAMLRKRVSRREIKKISQDRLKELVHYNPEDGTFRWRQSRGRMAAGQLAGVISNGYVQIRILSQRYMAHRLAFLFMNGVWPLQDIDHINGCRSDNSWKNLREASRAENCANAKISSTNTTGFKGVTFSQSRGKYEAQIKVNGRRKFLGRFSTAEAAHKSYCDAAVKMFGRFARFS